MRYLLFIFVLAFPAITHAQGNPGEDVIEALCTQFLSFETPPAVSSVNYVPGIDVHGNAVVSADLSDNGAILNNPIVLPIDIDLAKRYGLDLPAGAETTSNIANISIYPDGRISYEKEEISNAVKSFCQSQNDEMKKNQSNQAEQHGHESSNPVLSSDKIEGQFPD